MVLAVAQMGVHLVFFLHITTGPDNYNNVLALAFGVLDRGANHHRLDMDHDQHESQHDADAYADGIVDVSSFNGAERMKLPWIREVALPRRSWSVRDC